MALSIRNSQRKMFVPKLVTTLKTYSRKQFLSDLVAGIVVGIVALPLAIAFGIASGVTPEKGIITAIVGGFIISATGGSRVQIGGPTGAFIVIVYGIVQTYGIAGLTIATLIAGFLLIIMGLARLGSIIKYIPYPLIVGFTAGIALIIFSSEIKDFFGLNMPSVPADFVQKWIAYFEHFKVVNIYAIIMGLTTVLIIVLLSKLSHRIPGALIAILICTLFAVVFHLPVETIGTRFGVIQGNLPKPVVSHIDLAAVQYLIRPAFTIAILGAIESLLSAVVADGMIGGNNRSNMELVAQGIANIASSIFGGIPATGAIARTATNVKNGGRTPVAGMVHAVTLLLIMIIVGKWARLIPMACLAGILVVVAYNMSEWRSFAGLLRGPRADAVVLLVTFSLTILVDLTIAIEIGMVLAAFLFIRRISKVSKVDFVTQDISEDDDDNDPHAIKNYNVPKGVEVFEIKGPFFFGAAYKFKEAISVMENTPKVVIIRMLHVPIIDATALNALMNVYKDMKKHHIGFMLSEIQPGVFTEMEKYGLLDKIGERNVFFDIQDALIASSTTLIRISGKPIR